jgi:hypothetical protein
MPYQLARSNLHLWLAGAAYQRRIKSDITPDTIAELIRKLEAAELPSPLTIIAWCPLHKTRHDILEHTACGSAWAEWALRTYGGNGYLEHLADDVELRRAAAKSLKGFCLTYLPHHFPADLSDFFDEMSTALQDPYITRLEMIGFRGCAKSTMASLALPLWAALEHPERYPFIIMLADTTAQASMNMAIVQHELRDNELILRDYDHLKYRRIDDPRPEPTLESDEDWQKMNCVLDNGVRILARSRAQKVRGLKHRRHRPYLIVADDVEDLD